ncbi:major facilitator superfamily domain-containing protein [Xylaria flabelliformis]|nr:major facilitator superfamily domain-containing protein [Xylaria flabelliformis]
MDHTLACSPVESATLNISDNHQTLRPQPAQKHKSIQQDAPLQEESKLSEKTSEEMVLKPQERSIRGLRWFLVCFAIFSANLLFGLDNTIAADIQGAVSDTYHDTERLGWLGVGFTLGSAAGILPLGKAYSIFDNKWVFISCLLNFSAASALCGAAPTMNALIVGRVWAGFGGAGMYLGTLNLSTALVLPKEQPLYVGITGFVYGSGCILGPVVGGLLADSPATWRWSFYLNLIIFGLTTPVYLFVLPSIPRQMHLSLLAKLKLLDWLGIALSWGMFTAFTLGFLSGGVVWEWDDGRTIANIVVFGALLVLFTMQQTLKILTNSDNRLFPCIFLRNPQLVLLYIIMSCGGGATLFVAIYYIPFFRLFVDGASGTRAAVALLPFISFYVASVLICGAIMSRTGYHMVWFLVSGLFITAGGAAMYTVTKETANANFVGYTILLGVGLTTSQASYAVGNELVEPSLAADLIQLINISQGSSQLIGLAIASTIFQTQAFDGIRQILGPEYTSDNIQAAIAGARSNLLSSVQPEIRDAIIDVIVGAINKVWILVIAAGAVHTACSIFLTRSRFVAPREKTDEPTEVVVALDL